MSHQSYCSKEMNSANDSNELGCHLSLVKPPEEKQPYCHVDYSLERLWAGNPANCTQTPDPQNSDNKWISLSDANSVVICYKAIEKLILETDKNITRKLQNMWHEHRHKLLNKILAKLWRMIEDCFRKDWPHYHFNICRKRLC